MPWLIGMDCGHVTRLGDQHPRGYGYQLTCLHKACHCRRQVISAEFLGEECKNCGQDIPEEDVHGPHFDLCMTCRGARIPPHSPYKAGDRVQVHGYLRWGRHPDDPRATGWRGTVEGTLGAKILTGITDDGRCWAETWGGLRPDGTPPRDRFTRCTCRPPPLEQGTLF